MRPNDRNLHNADSGFGDEALEYALGEMTPSEEAEFELRLNSESALRSRVEAWNEDLDGAKDWMLAEPPGLRKVEGLNIEAIISQASPPSERSRFSKAWARFTETWSHDARVQRLRVVAAGAFTIAVIAFSLAVIWRSMSQSDSSTPPSYVKENNPDAMRFPP